MRKGTKLPLATSVAGDRGVDCGRVRVPRRWRGTEHPFSWRQRTRPTRSGESALQMDFLLRLCHLPSGTGAVQSPLRGPGTSQFSPDRRSASAGPSGSARRDFFLGRRGCGHRHPPRGRGYEVTGGPFLMISDGAH